MILRVAVLSGHVSVCPCRHSIAYREGFRQGRGVFSSESSVDNDIEEGNAPAQSEPLSTTSFTKLFPSRRPKCPRRTTEPSTDHRGGQANSDCFYSCAPPQPFDFADGRRLQARMTTRSATWKWTTHTYKTISASRPQPHDGSENVGTPMPAALRLSWCTAY
eukprot:scaffold108751_cov14-Prasinocladus_malaysianus.AAC.1